jgi:hypothetical protein
MGARRINPNLAKIHHSYTARELADRLGVHKNTIRHWQRNGLSPVDDQRPYVFDGAVVRQFLKSRNQGQKRPCPAGTLYCFSCHEPRQPSPTSVEYVQTRVGAGSLRAQCSECGTTMRRRIRHAAVSAVLPGLLVQIRQESSRLDGSSSPSSNCDLERQMLA